MSYGDVRSWGSRARTGPRTVVEPALPPHAHFVCRTCFTKVCETGQGHLTPMLCMGCAGCSWVYLPAALTLREQLHRLAPAGRARAVYMLRRPCTTKGAP